MFWKVLNSKKSTYEPIISDVSNKKLEHTVDPVAKVKMLSRHLSLTSSKQSNGDRYVIEKDSGRVWIIEDEPY